MNRDNDKGKVLVKRSLILAFIEFLIFINLVNINFLLINVKNNKIISKKYIIILIAIIIIPPKKFE